MAHVGADARHALHRKWTHLQSVSMAGLRGFIAVLIAALVLLPSWAALTTAVTFLLKCGGDRCIGDLLPLWRTGLLTGLLSWLIFAALFYSYARAEHVIPSSFDEIQTRLTQLQTQEPILKDHPAVPHSVYAEFAGREAHEQIERIVEELKDTGLPWILATGYIRIWERLHRAEEALIEVQPSGAVIAGALNDVLRLDGSKIAHCKELRGLVEQAVVVIDPSAQRYLHQVGTTAVPPLVITSVHTLDDAVVDHDWSETLVASGGTPPYHWMPNGRALPRGLTLSAAGTLSGAPKAAGKFQFTARVTDSVSVTATKEFVITVHRDHQATHAAHPATHAADSSMPGVVRTPADAITLARAVLRSVRRAINEYVDSSYMVFVVTRNRLATAMSLTGMAGYVLLTVAVLTGAPRHAIAAASAFYLVGAIIGLLRRLHSESQKEATVEVLDYGLSEMRLLSMPTVSGLAAILGVVFINLLPLAGNLFSHPQGSPTVQPMALVDIFDLRNGKNVVGLLAAAVFGLTPDLLFTQLQKQAEKYASDVKNSETTQSHPGT